MSMTPSRTLSVARRASLWLAALVSLGTLAYALGKFFGASFADLFGAMNDEARALLEDATGASWAPRPSMLDGEADTGPAPMPPASISRRLSFRAAPGEAAARAFCKARMYSLPSPSPGK